MTDGSCQPFNLSPMAATTCFKSIASRQLNEENPEISLYLLVFYMNIFNIKSSYGNQTSYKRFAINLQHYFALQNKNIKKRKKKIIEKIGK